MFSCNVNYYNLHVIVYQHFYDISKLNKVIQYEMTNNYSARLLHKQ